MDFDYEGADDYGGRILWGRIAIFGAALLLALLLGRCTAGGGASDTELTEAQAAVEAAAETIAQRDETIAELQQRLVRAESAQQNGTATPGTPANGDGDGNDDTTTPGGVQTDAEGNQTYEVQPGDTLSTIAQTVYGDPTAFGIIATANNLSGGSTLQVGQQLIIPPNPDAQ